MIFRTIVLFILTLSGAHLEMQDTLLPNNPFVSIWNAPTEGCEKHFGVKLNFSYFDIVANKDHTFEGDEIVIYYNLGVFPRYTRNNETVNGGIPQLGNLNLHLTKVQQEVEQFIPKKTFTGLAVIDWESWRPIYERNNYNPEMRIYIEASKGLVRKEHPDWPEDKIRRQAGEDFQLAARKFMLTTLQVCEQLRPLGKWGYYGFPNCYNYAAGQKECSNRTKYDNDGLTWMFGNSGAIMPSVYLSEHFGTLEDRKLYVYGQLKEALRVKGSNSRAAVLPYSRFKYRDTGNFYNVGDLKNTIQQSADAGLAGIALWGASASFETKTHCEATRDFIDNTLGPLVKKITTFAMNCSATICHSHGRCVRRDWTKEEVWHFRPFNENDNESQGDENSESVSLLHSWWPKFSFGIWDIVTLIVKFINLSSTTVKETRIPEDHAVHRRETETSMNRKQKINVGLGSSMVGWSDSLSDFDCRCYTRWHGEFCQNNRN